MPSIPNAHRRLAALMLAQGWNRALMTAAVRAVWPGDDRDAIGLVDHAMAAWRLPYPPDERALADLLAVALPETGMNVPLVTVPGADAPSGPRAGAGLPEIASPSDLADYLRLSEPHLDWFADCDGRLARPGADRFGHYTQTWLRKRRGGRRLVEAPLPRLKSLQRRILRGILDRVPVHPAAYGFVAGRNCVQAAGRHAGEAVVISLDLADFFSSVPAARVHAIFRTLGYPPAVARLLTGLTTVRTPQDVLAALAPAERQHWRAPHLPQGAPTSPALANLAARRLDVRLAGLARRLGATYTRYADDLTFSGDRGLGFDGARPFLEIAGEIIRDCGFRANSAKTRVMRRGRPQRVTGLSVNAHLNVPRQDYDRLKAILTNCVRHGPDSQNRTGHPAFRAHLDGRIGWVEAVNPRRGTRLRTIFDRIDWS